MMYPNYYLPNHYYSMGFGFNLFSFIIMILFWWLVIMIVIKVLRAIFNHRENEGEEDNNLEIVRERYAKGEIKKKEYEQLMKDLS